uniref:SPRY domain-containing protein n=1 Tax=Alexandrium catenella TaxID=2925 RepID=A0A7S1WHN3_ALECA
MGAGLCCCCPPPSQEDWEQQPSPQARVNIGRRGTQVQVGDEKGRATISGDGTALADTVIEQDAAYWEVQVKALGAQCNIGVAYATNFQLLDSQIGDRQSSWAVGPPAQELKEGDVIGVAFGQGDIPNLRFFHNGAPLDDATVARVRGEAHPAVSVGGGTVLTMVFDPSGFAHTPPGRHTEVRPPRKMM